MSKIILKDKTEIEVIALPSMSAISTQIKDLAAVQTLKDKLTAANLSEVKTANDAGLTVGNYTDQVLDDVWTIQWTDKGVLATFGLHDKTELEKLEDQVAVHDSAITDLGSAVAELAGGAQ